ncbi:glycosyltransferase family 2 protein [Shewanella putrefaciens]|uniref:glycosyltransferase family 2 protein n=1 Tax=Shewanella putrefaciens TaxID=24 RepID=UPI003D78D0EB
MKVAAVIVTYNPDVDKLDKLVVSILEQVNNIIIVDNASVNGWDNSIFNDRCTVHKLESNLGIGAAQNIGVSFASDLDLPYTILFDQDSYAQNGLVKKLLEGFKFKDVVAVGPEIYDSRSGRIFPYFTYFKYKRVRSDSLSQIKDGFYYTDVLISSGTVVDNSFFNVNPNNESLFIEYVDVEWCLRVRSKGKKIVFSKNVRLEHELGDERKKIFGLEFPVHKPHRYFYVVRNALFCSSEKQFPFSFRSYNILRLVVLLFFVLLVTNEKKETLMYIYNGLKSKV